MVKIINVTFVMKDEALDVNETRRSFADQVCVVVDPKSGEIVGVYRPVATVVTLVNRDFDSRTVVDGLGF